MTTPTTIKSGGPDRDWLLSISLRNKAVVVLNLNFQKVNNVQFDAFWRSTLFHNCLFVFFLEKKKKKKKCDLFIFFFFSWNGRFQNNHNTIEVLFEEEPFVFGLSLLFHIVFTE